jgi:hypothetical protein
MLVFRFRRSLGRTSANRQFHNYRHALVRDIDGSLPAQALSFDNNLRATLDVSLAKHQHASLVNAINSCNDIEEVFALPSDGFADSVFVEDTAGDEWVHLLT